MGFLESFFINKNILIIYSVSLFFSGGLFLINQFISSLTIKITLNIKKICIAFLMIQKSILILTIL